MEAAGYRVVDEGYEGEADLAIVTEGARASGNAAALITLSADPDAGSASKDRLYRYDRSGLLARLATLRAEKAA